jgi:glucokinase
MTRKIVAGIDIGGTKIALGLGDLNGGLLSLSHFPTQVETGPHRILDTALTRLEKMAEEADATIVSVGVCCGGPLDRQQGLILSPPNLPGWDEFPIIKLLEERLGVHALLDNDANAAALGELHYGAGRGLHDLIYLTISTGIGGGLIIAGELVHGVADAAGEVGHMTVLPDGPLCGCGARGCLEALCSGTSIARRARERLLDGSHNSSMSPDEVTAKIVAEAARNGDTLAREVWDETIYYLAIGISTVISILAPEAVILGGGVSMAGDQLLEPLRRQVAGRVKMLPGEKINILQASLAGDSGIYGALLLAQRAGAFVSFGSRNRMLS